jgi:gamma-glutamyl-gamma-aminobutyrate hydrolase PuuD
LDTTRAGGRLDLEALRSEVEALEDPSRPFVLGVLWHPEEDEKSHLIKALVSEVS